METNLCNLTPAQRKIGQAQEKINNRAELAGKTAIGAAGLVGATKVLSEAVNVPKMRMPAITKGMDNFTSATRDLVKIHRFQNHRIKDKILNKMGKGLEKVWETTKSFYDKSLKNKVDDFIKTFKEADADQKGAFVAVCALATGFIVSTIVNAVKYHAKEKEIEQKYN